MRLPTISTLFIDLKKRSLQLFLIGLMFSPILHEVHAQSIFFPNSPKTKIKKCRVILKDGTKVKGYVYTIDQNNLILAKQRASFTENFINNCQGCQSISISEIQKISFQKLDDFGKISMGLAFAGLTTFVIASLADNVGPEENRGTLLFSAFFLYTSGIIMAPTSIALLSRRKTRNFYPSKWNDESLEKASKFSQKHAYEKKFRDQLQFLKGYQSKLKINPHKYLDTFQFYMNEENMKIGYITKITTTQVFLTSDYNEVVKLRMNKGSTSTMVDLAEIKWIEKIEN